MEVLAAANVASPELMPTDALSVLLTVESLIFAAFGIAVTLAAPSTLGRSRFFTSGVLASLVALALILVAAGAAAAWWDLFVRPAEAPTGTVKLEAAALAAGIVAPPLLTILIAIFLRR